MVKNIQPQRLSQYASGNKDEKQNIVRNLNNSDFNSL